MTAPLNGGSANSTARQTTHTGGSGATAELRLEPDLTLERGLAMQALYHEQTGEPDPSHVGDADD